jgi:hypothetical protein
MDKRDFLRAHGFTVGSRGRFSKEMLEVLKDYKEDTPKPEYETLTLISSTPAKVESPSLVINSTVIRPARILEGYTAEGYILKFVECANCYQHMVYCECAAGVKAPSSVIHSTDPLVRV